MTIINIRECEQPYDSSDGYQATVAFDDGEKFPCTIINPFSIEQENDLEWYLDRYSSIAENDEKAKAVAASVENYGKQLFDQVIEKNRNIFRNYINALRKIEELCIEITGSPTFHSLHWETLYDSSPEIQKPLALKIPLVRKSPTSSNYITTELRHSPTINLLLVVARPEGKDDVNYRSISRPLVESLRQAKLRVKIDMLRPGTYHALIEHLEEITAKQGRGYYQIIHFDVHGELLSHQQLQQGLTEERYTVSSEIIQAFEESKAFLFMETGTENQSEPVAAEELAKLLVTHNIPIAILNACESGKQVGLMETSLSGQFMAAGIQMVLAMRYTITASAATLLMPTLYKKLFDKHDVASAIRLARSQLYREKTRRDSINQKIVLEDWIIPVVYQNTNNVRLPLRDFKGKEKEVYHAHIVHHDPKPPYQFVGRDFEVLQLESRLRQRNVLLIQGVCGIGKTAFLHHLGEWWQTTGFVNKVFYFGYDESAWTCTEVLVEIAKKLLSAENFSLFKSLSSVEEQQEMVAKELRSQPHLLIFDALECLIEQTEKKTLHGLLVNLVGGKTLVLLGSQHDENLLVTGTFEDNIYPLSGVDHKSALIFLTSTLERNHINYDIDDIHTLVKLLAYQPLSLTIMTRAMTETQTVKEVLSVLPVEADMGSDKPQNGLHAAINYVYNHLFAPEEQGLLLCLAPFQPAVAIDMNTLLDYGKQLQQQPTLAHLLFDNWLDVLEKVARWGLLHFETDILLRTAFTDFLRNRLPEKPEWKTAIETAFQQYYDSTCEKASPSKRVTIRKNLDLPEELVERFQQKRVALFIGAGCSRSVGFPSLKKLLQNMQERFSRHLSNSEQGKLKGWFKKVEDYPRIAQLFKSTLKESYRKEMRRIFDVAKLPQQLPKYLSCLGNFPINRIITTNFDNVLEHALGMGWATHTWREREEIADYLRDDRPLIFHLHGRADSYDSLVHALSDYKDLEGVEGQPARDFVKHLFSTHAILLVGYGLGDPVIQWVQSYLQNEWAIKPDWYMLVPNPTEKDYQPEMTERQLNLLAYPFDDKKPAHKAHKAHTEGLNQWFDALAKELELDNTSPPDLPKEVPLLLPKFPGFSEINKTFLDKQAEVEQYVRQRYYHGEPVQWNLVMTGYTARRVATDQILDYLQGKGLRAILLTGAGGEGKSTILMQVALALYEQGYRVFHAPEPSGYVREILREIKEPLAVLIDQADLLQGLGELLRFANNRYAPTCIVLAARTHEWQQARAKDSGDTKRYLHTIRTGRLTLKEAQNIAKNLLDSSTVSNIKPNILANRLFNDTNGFLLAAMLTATHGESLATLLADVIEKISQWEDGQELLIALGYVVTLEAHENKEGQPYFCSFRLFKEALEISEKEVRPFCAQLTGEVRLQPRGGYRVETRHPVIAKTLLPILFQGEMPYLDEIEIHERLIRATGRLYREYDKPQERKFLTVLPSIQRKNHHYDSARTLYKIASEIDPKNASVLTSWGFLEKEQNNIGTLDEPHCARWLFKQATEVEPNNAEILKQWATMEKGQNNTGTLDEPYSARWLFNQGTKADPNNIDVWQRWAISEKDSDNIGTLDEPYCARWLFKQGMDATSSKNVHILETWAALEKEQGNIGTLDKPYCARWLLKQGTKADPNNADIWTEWANLEKGQDNIGTLEEPYCARWLFNQGTRADPNNIDVWQRWAISEKDSDNIGTLDEPYCARWLFKQGMEATSSKNVINILEPWAALEKDQGNIGTLEEPYCVRWLFKQGIEVNPKYVSIWQSWAILEKEQNNIGTLDEPYCARWLFKQSIDIETKRISWIMWAEMEKEQNNIGTIDKLYCARWLFKQGIEVNPKYVPIWQSWAILEREQNNIGTLDEPYCARWLFKQGTDAYQKNVLLWETWAVMEKEIGDIVTAEQIAQQGLVHIPNAPTLQEFLEGLHNNDDGDDDEPFAEVREWLKQNECEKVKVFLRDALFDDPQNPQLLDLHKQWRELCGKRT